MRKFTGKSIPARKYLSKRKLKKQAFKKRLNAHMQKMYELEPNSAVDYQDDPLRFSDDEDEYNYYTGSDDDEEYEQEEEESYSRFRAFTSLLMPLLVSATAGMYLYKQHENQRNEC